MHLASLRHPLSSCWEWRYETPQMRAFLDPWAFKGNGTSEEGTEEEDKKGGGEEGEEEKTKGGEGGEED